MAKTKALPLFTSKRLWPYFAYYIIIYSCIMQSFNNNNNSDKTRPIQIEDKSSKKNNVMMAIIPAYNESESIGKVVSETNKHVSSVIVVDDGSSDNTAEVA